MVIIIVCICTMKWPQIVCDQNWTLKSLRLETGYWLFVFVAHVTSKSGTLSLNTVVNFGHTPATNPAETVPRGSRHDCRISVGAADQGARARARYYSTETDKSVLQSFFCGKARTILERHLSRRPRSARDISRDWKCVFKIPLPFRSVLKTSNGVE